jgi:hypothetical protein
VAARPEGESRQRFETGFGAAGHFLTTFLDFATSPTSAMQTNVH